MTYSFQLIYSTKYNNSIVSFRTEKAVDVEYDILEYFKSKLWVSTAELTYKHVKNRFLKIENFPAVG